MIQDLFKTPIYKTSLSLDNKAICSYCLDYAKRFKGRSLSNKGGYQSNNLPLKEKKLKTFYNSIKEHSFNFAKSLEIKNSLVLSNVWININGYKDFNIPHNHPGGILSGVYYVETPKDCGNIYFQHPCYDTFQYDWKGIQTNFNEYNSPQWWLTSQTGQLYIFPSWLNHYVDLNLNKMEKRISISFNFS